MAGMYYFENTSSKSYQNFLRKLAEELTVDNLRSLKFLLHDTLFVGDIGKVPEAHAYIELLKVNQIIHENDLSYLRKSFDVIRRNDLIKMIDEFEKSQNQGNDSNKAISASNADWLKKPSSFQYSQNVFKCFSNNILDDIVDVATDEQGSQEVQFWKKSFLPSSGRRNVKSLNCDDKGSS
ncbi:uncharacterized protein LOC105849905 isoform X1 [Hydra vulgaris]|uniref:uncharacterized protein LOC105849905 isoform X1 n=1 Tax=Hydra vulgaris TaxID=6087 RepID=UPI001F5F81E5|nr:uncharacterized protein LOC105849905 isoform X1 [Hydra vulgaris]